MRKKIDYSRYFDEAFLKVRGTKDESADALTNIKCSPLFEIESENFSQQMFITDVAYKEFYKSFSKILIDSLKKFEKNYVLVLDVPVFAFITQTAKGKILYYFKKWGIPTQMDKCIVDSLLKNKSADSYKFISLVEEEEAESYLFKKKSDQSGNSVRFDYSLKEFYESMFDLDEYQLLLSNIKEFKTKVTEYIGYITVKNLTPSTTYEFKRKIELELVSKKYTSSLAEKKTNNVISDKLIDELEQQLYIKKYYKSILGNNTFSESLITAEWMKSSLSDAKNVDLTIIAMGYFKAIEQFLYDYIVLHSDEDKLINKMPHIKNKPHKIYLNETSISKKWANFMLDSMITFINDYKCVLFNPLISETDVEYIMSELDNLKRLRNSFFHKDNIHNISTVEETRRQAMLVISLLLGCLIFREEDLKAFNLLEAAIDEKQKLYEYLYYHSYSVFYLKENDSISHPFVATRENKPSYDETGTAIFPIPVINISIFDSSAIDIPCNEINNKQLILSKQLLALNDNTIIYEGTMTPNEKGISLSGPIKMIYMNKKFVNG